MEEEENRRTLKRKKKGGLCWRNCQFILAGEESSGAERG